jgi:hypothetical protein
MATFNASKAITAATARPLPRAQLRAARAGTFRCAAYSKDGVKAWSAINLSLAVLKRMEAMELRSLGPSCSTGLVEERVDTEDTRVQRLSRALNPESHWVVACVVKYIFFNCRR